MQSRIRPRQAARIVDAVDAAVANWARLADAATVPAPMAAEIAQAQAAARRW